jgi:hypothetical protein
VSAAEFSSDPGSAKGLGEHPKPAPPSPDVQTVCRWLPRAYPAGAFSGRHDRVHVNNRHGLVNLWGEEAVVHEGDYVGPPRGGMIPNQAASYAIAMPAGGYLHVEQGIVISWSEEVGPGPLVRADGELFDQNDYSTTMPYFSSQYGAMSLSDCRRAIVGVRRRRLGASAEPPKMPANQASDPRTDSEEQVESLLQLIHTSQPPTVCDCDRKPEEANPPIWPRSGGAVVPGALLRHASAVATMAGVGNPDDAIDVIWRLTGDLADPLRAGLVKAAESAARRLDSAKSPSHAAGLPEAPLTEEAVALVAAQAVRWHGAAIVPRLPFWTLGWIFLAKPVLDQLETDLLGPSELQHALDQADRIRVDRAHQVWVAANEATTALEKMTELANGQNDLRPSDLASVIDLRIADHPAAAFPQQRNPTAPQAYSQDIATTLARLAER